MKILIPISLLVLGLLGLYFAGCGVVTRMGFSGAEFSLECP